MTVTSRDNPLKLICDTGMTVGGGVTTPFLRVLLTTQDSQVCMR
jgi:hypothetical protein